MTKCKYCGGLSSNSYCSNSCKELDLKYLNDMGELYEAKEKECLIDGCYIINSNSFNVCDKHSRQFDEIMERKHPGILDKIREINKND